MKTTIASGVFILLIGGTLIFGGLLTSIVYLLFGVLFVLVGGAFAGLLPLITLRLDPSHTSGISTRGSWTTPYNGQNGRRNGNNGVDTTAAQPPAATWGVSQANRGAQGRTPTNAGPSNPNPR